MWTCSSTRTRLCFPRPILGGCPAELLLGALLGYLGTHMVIGEGHVSLPCILLWKLICHGHPGSPILQPKPALGSYMHSVLSVNRPLAAAIGIIVRTCHLCETFLQKQTVRRILHHQSQISKPRPHTSIRYHTSPANLARPAHLTLS